MKRCFLATLTAAALLAAPAFAENVFVDISFKTAKSVSEFCPVHPDMVANPPNCFISPDPVPVELLARSRSLERIMETNDVSEDDVIAPNTFFYLG